MEAAKTHRHPVVPVQCVVPGGHQTDVVGDVQDAARAETQHEDEEDQGADPDEGHPVAAGAAQVEHHGHVSAHTNYKRCDEAQEDQCQSVRHQHGVGVLLQRKYVMAGGDPQPRQVVALPHQ